MIKDLRNKSVFLANKKENIQSILIYVNMIILEEAVQGEFVILKIYIKFFVGLILVLLLVRMIRLKLIRLVEIALAQALNASTLIPHITPITYAITTVATNTKT